MCGAGKVPLFRRQSSVFRGRLMEDPRLILLLDLFVAAFVVANVVRMLRTGIARDWLSNTATRDGQPARYWRSIYSSYAVLAFCAVTFVWAMAWPESLR